MKKTPWCLLLLSIGLFTLLYACALKPPPFDEERWRSEVRSADPDLLYHPHFKDTRFFNPWMPEEKKSIFRLLRWKLTPAQNYTEEERTYLPALVETAEERILALPHDDFIMWIGHGTFLIRVNGVFWLIDPIFSERAFLPKRKIPPGIGLDALKRIAPDLRVIVTHNHYDHLDEATVLDLPETTRIYVPLGLKPYFRSLNRNNVTEMDWWQERDCGNGIRLVCLPMQHWSRRLGQGWNETLWASFMLITPGVKIYLGGDTGYFVGHREIGKRFPGIDYALLPTTAYHPRWFMHYNHMNIDETLEAFQDLNARFMIPHQWGTFQLGDDPPGYPALELKREIAARRLDPNRFIIMDIGEIRAIPNAK